VNPAEFVESFAGTQFATISPTQGVTYAGSMAGVSVAPAQPGQARPDVEGPLRVGRSFGPRYHVIKLLGVGGMGAVYQAWDSELSVAVALKVIRVDRGYGTVTPEAEKRFKNELLLARQVTHKNVVRIHDLGEIDGIKYITMPYIQSEDLATTLRRDGKLPIALALRLARQIAAGLEAAHDAGVVHRDLKPANVMITVTADEVQAQIMDFGISVSASDAASDGVTGTPEYMAPEQSTGGAVDARADIYAFGLIVYEMLAGPRPAATGQARIDAMDQRCKEGMARLRGIEPEIPEALETLVMRCLECDPAARFHTTHELNAALAALDDTGEVIPEARHLTARVMTAAAVLVIAMLAGTSFLTRRAVEPVKQHAPVSVVIADFQNGTNDPAFDRTLEPMLKRALEGAGFISAYDRTGINALGVRPPEKLDEAAARELAAKQGLGVVLSGSIDPRGSGYAISVKAVQTVTGSTIASGEGRASRKDEVLEAATRLAARVRNALGDDTSDSAQMFAMASLSATSLEVLRHYSAGREASATGKFDEARRSYARTVELDPKFGIGYQALATLSLNQGNLQDAEKYFKEALRYLDSMTERERYTTRGMYYRMTGDYQQCVKEYSDLIARYAADVVAHNNLALCSTFLRDMPTALAEMQRAVQILPNRALFRINLALYANYAGDFQIGEREARIAQKLGSPLGLVPLAYAQLGQGQLSQTAQTYRELENVDSLGPTAASHAASGLGDLAVFEGRLSDAARIFREGAATDLASKNFDRAAAKFASLAYAELLRGQQRAAVAAVENALTNSKAVKIRFLAARSLVEAGDIDRARPLIAGLASELQPEPQAYAKIVEGEIALKNRDARQAIKVVTEANTLLDTWIGHFVLGRAYLEAGAFAQADSELDRCLKRRGEALSLFLDEEPTYGYFPPVYYYQGRVREALNNAGFAESYRTYLTFRGQSTEDPLLPEVRSRAGAE